VLSQKAGWPVTLTTHKVHVFEHKVLSKVSKSGAGREKCEILHVEGHCGTCVCRLCCVQRAYT
jgi:hypothetical protein